MTEPREPLTVDTSRLNDNAIRAAAWRLHKLATAEPAGRPRPLADFWLALSAELDERLTQRRRTLDATAVDLDEYDGRGHIVSEDQAPEELLAARERLRAALFAQAEERDGDDS